MKGIRKAFGLVRAVVPGPAEVELHSSAISSVSYDRARRSLRVQFRRGKIYEFGSVEPWRYRQLINSSSVGRYFVSEIRNRYPYRQLEA
jgi:lysyl-tRNA synthetase class 2